MIKILQDSAARVVAMCDQCESEITNGHTAFYVYEMDTDQPTDCFTVHQECLDLFEDSRSFELMGTLELACLPIYLLNNLNADLEKAQKQSAYFSSL